MAGDLTVAIIFWRTSRIFNVRLCLLGKMLLCVSWKELVAWPKGHKTLTQRHPLLTGREEADGVQKFDHELAPLLK